MPLSDVHNGVSTGGDPEVAAALPAQDRALLLAGAVVIAVAIVVAVLLRRIDSDSGSVSSYGVGPAGTKAAFLLLEETGYSPQRWNRPPVALADLPARATLILVDPVPSEQRDVEEVRAFLRRGGHVVATGMTFGAFLPEQHTRSGAPHFQEKIYRPRIPSALTRGISAISLAPQVYFREPAAEDAPFQDGEEIPVAEFSYGRGKVTWWGSSHPLSNHGIREQDNAQLLLNSVGQPGDGPVLWDEYFHQGGKTVVDTILGSSLRWGLVQIALAGAVVCATWSRRFGPVRASIAEKRLAPMDFVNTLAALYRRSKAANVALEIAYERFRLALQRRYSIRHNARPEAAGQTLGETNAAAEVPGTASILDEIEREIRNAKLSPEAATTLIQRLYLLAGRLNLKL